MNTEILNLKNKYERDELISFLNRFGLSFDENIDLTLVIRSSERIVATASKAKNIIKCFAVDDFMRGEGITNILVTSLLNQSFREGFFHNFVFTKPSNISIFEGVGFKLISKTDKVALLEIGNKTISKTISDIKERLTWKENTNNGILIMNCNPFTLGHQFLIETASEKMDNLLVLIVEEDKSSYPFLDRIELVKKGTCHLKNVTILPSSEYVISSATFPNYFLRKEDDFLLEFMKLDTTITAEYFCRGLNIFTRFVGEEPYCPITQKYNETMKDILQKYEINLEIIPRKQINNIAISASKVRELVKHDNYEELKTMVPESTYEYLISKKGKEIAEKIKHSDSAH